MAGKITALLESDERCPAATDASLRELITSIKLHS